MEIGIGELDLNVSFGMAVSTTVVGDDFAAGYAMASFRWWDWRLGVGF